MNDSFRDNDQNSAIILPLKKRELGNFITSLLGQQQSLERTSTIKFDIDHIWLVNLHDLIHQRICQQASANLVDFVAIIYFESGLKRTITSAEAFAGYVETKQETTVGVTLLWSYLIQFPGKEYPEKQEIRFHAKIKNNETNPTQKQSQKSPIRHLYTLASETENSLIEHEISHTERTWGDDIESLISKHIDTIKRPEGGLVSLIYNCFRWALAVGIFTLLSTYPFYHALTGATEPRKELMRIYGESLNSAPSLDLLSNKLDLIAQMISAPNEKTGGIFFVVLIFFAPFIAAFTLRITNRTTHSFLTLSKIDALRKEALLKKENKRLVLMAVGYILTILAGAMGNYAYNIIETIIN